MSPVRVRHIPAGHAYVEHLMPPGGEASPVVHLPDPPVPGAPPGRWWPHPALEAAWVRQHSGDQDVMHLHFGTESRTPAELESWLSALRAAGLPLVHTVHDIDHPHLLDQASYREQLALLVDRADGLLTLTEGAADRLERTYGRRPLVVPHPHVAPLERLDTSVVGRGPLRIGLHVKSLRTNVAPMTVLPALLEVLPTVRSRTGRPALLEVRAHDDVFDPSGPRHDAELAALLRALRDDPPAGVTSVVAPRLDDDALWDYLEGLDVSVLAYAWATHSGWVEACRDLGTWVLAPDVGHLVEQGNVLAWGPPGTPADPDRLIALLCHAAAAPPVRPGRRAREQQRADLARRHAQVYEAVLAGERVDADAETRRGTTDG